MYIFVLFIGLCVGSFLNVAVYRLPRGMSLSSPPSHCPCCNMNIAWYDNIPIISWLALRGVCRKCGVLISARYLTIEFLTGVLFVALFYVHLHTQEPAPLAYVPAFGAYLILLAALVVASFTDIQRMIIPDEISLGGMYVGPVLCGIFPQIIPHDTFSRELLFVFGTGWSEHMISFAASLVGMGVGAGAIYFSGALGKLIFRKEAMGFGDVKLMGMVGAFLGWQGAVLGFVAACIAGAVIGVFLIIRRRDTHIPFGPYLALGSLIVMLFREPIINFILNPVFRG